MVFVERIAIEVDGEGDAVLMIHGLGGMHQHLDCLARRLRAPQALRLDPPVPAAPGEWKVRFRSKFVDQRNAPCGCQGPSAHVVAHSMGTIVAAHLAAAEPAMVRSLALFGPLLAPPDQARVGIRARAARARQEGMTGIADSLVAGIHLDDTKQRRHVAVAFVRESLIGRTPTATRAAARLSPTRQSADTTRIAWPTLLVTGDEDVVAPAADGAD